jgi:WXG100 family type VII secretion target
MAGSFQTGSAELQKAGQQMMQTNQELQSNMAKLAGEVEQIQSTWKGQAATAFQTLMERFATDAKNLNTSLENIATAIDTNAKNYAQQEEEAKSSVSAIMNTLGG